MTTQMIIALAITALMVVLIMMDKLPFGAPPLLACLLLVIFGIADIKAAFGGFSNATIVMLAEFMAIIAALQKTSFIANFKKTMFKIANQGGIKAYMLMILIVMLGCSLFGTGSTAYYVMVIGFLSLGFLLNCVIQYKFLPDHPIAASTDAAVTEDAAPSLPKWKEQVTYFVFILAVVGMLLQSKIGDAGYAIAGISVGVILVTGVMDFKEIRDSISAPIILMSAGVIGVADALGSTGLTDLVGSTVANMLGTNVNPFVMIFVFCILTSVLATLTGSTIGTVYVFAPLAIATCTSLGLDPTAAACAIVISGWCGHFLPIDGMPAMVMGVGNYSSKEFCKFTIPQYFIRLLALTAGALLVFPM